MSRAWLYFRRGLALRCPECGISRLFIPVRRVRRLDDWMQPLDGCPRCGFAYQREPGYFLIATWAINYGVVGVFGLGAALLAESVLGLSVTGVLLLVLPPLPVLSVLLTRHAKSLFLALDHYFDPHRPTSPRGPTSPPGTR